MTDARNDSNARVDFGLRSADYARHRPGLPASFFDRIEAHVPIAGLDVVDLGTGPGVVALDLARRGARVTGVDRSENQVTAGRERARALGLEDRCTLVVAPAERTGLPDGVCDLVTAGQCWGWFDEAAAFAETHRLLRPRGWLVIAQYCYLPKLGGVAGATEEIVLRYNPDWTMAGFDGLYPQRIDAVIRGGFEFVEQFCYDEDRAFSHADWRGRMRTCNGVGSGGLGADETAAFDRELAALLAERFADEPLVIPHRVWAVVARRPS